MEQELDTVGADPVTVEDDRILPAQSVTDFTKMPCGGSFLHHLYPSEAVARLEHRTGAAEFAVMLLSRSPTDAGGEGWFEGCG